MNRRRLVVVAVAFRFRQTRDFFAWKSTLGHFFFLLSYSSLTLGENILSSIDFKHVRRLIATLTYFPTQPSAIVDWRRVYVLFTFTQRRLGPMTARLRYEATLRIAWNFNMTFSASCCWYIIELRQSWKVVGRKICVYVKSQNQVK